MLKIGLELKFDNFLMKLLLLLWPSKKKTF